jgi:membrane associated rhomboid family serine protease
MAGTPDLFVVCKNCRAEVSPYITECPYCGHRLRKRAPKLEKGAVPRRERRRPSTPSLPRLRPGELPGVRTDGRPVVTMALVLIAGLASVLWIAGAFDGLALTMTFGLQGDWYRGVATHFLFPATNFGSTAYELVTLGTVFLFGWLLERRHGHWAPLLVFVVASAAGVGLALLVDPQAMLLGANAGALGLLCAWSVRDLLALRAHREVDADMLGVAVFAALMLLMPAAVPEAHWAAGVGGAIAGLVMGVPLARLRER